MGIFIQSCHGDAIKNWGGVKISNTRWQCDDSLIFFACMSQVDIAENAQKHVYNI